VGNYLGDRRNQLKFILMENNISLKDFKDLWEQLDDYKKVEYLMQVLTDSCRYYPEFTSPFEILAWKLNLNINPEDQEVAKYIDK